MLWSLAVRGGGFARGKDDVIRVADGGGMVRAASRRRLITDLKLNGALTDGRSPNVAERMIPNSR
jgi:hypothetical protein